MLDLNLDIICTDLSSSHVTKFNDKNSILTSNCNHMEEEEDKDSSVNSSSIIINSAAAATEDENSSHNYTALIFDILKKENIDNKKNRNDCCANIQLFPESTSSNGLELDLSTTQWLKLSQTEPTSELELRIVQQKQQQIRKSRRGPRSRSSQYRGVTFYRRTGRWESHIWDCGKQVYLGGFDTALSAARAYDRAAIKFRGVDADINFNLSDYEEDMKLMRNLNKEEFIHILRRQSNGFARGSSKFRGVNRHRNGRWEEAARMDQFLGKKGYDMAAIKCNGRVEAVTNFEASVNDRQVVLDLSGGGSGYNLDLSLGISAHGYNNNNFKANTYCNFLHTDDKFPVIHRQKGESNATCTPLEGFASLSMASKNLQAMSGSLPENEEMVADKKRILEAYPLAKTSYWQWQNQ